MKPKKINHAQGRLFQQRLSSQLNPSNELYQLSKLIDWEFLEKEFSGLFVEKMGASAKPVRLVVGIIMLQQMNGFSDEGAVEEWVENPYWQFFCGYDYLEWEKPIDPSSLSRWRNRIGKDGAEKILQATINAAIKGGAVSARSLSKVIADTTVMEKNIAFPTDAKLYYNGIKTIVRMAKDYGIELRQTYTFLSKRALRKASQYVHARQMKRAEKERKRLKTFLGRTYRDIKNKVANSPLILKVFEPVLGIIEKILTQTRESKNKIYSIHEPHVECISKGKTHKKYEFGCKVSLVVTLKDGLALSVQALHGNPYDGHTLKTALKESENLSGVIIKEAFVDKGYKGHLIENIQIHISGKKKGVTAWLRKKINRRQAIEPQIGHMKNEGKLGRNFLKGIIGDYLNATLCGVGHNLKLIVRKLFSSRQAKQAIIPV
ncbi:MAG: IS5 family transposase [Bacteroidetes bacterium]|nr:IS5 family transposase [Bacteroidota bacterium]